ncbi:phosphatase PAP2 family protein [Candidatus Woesearchaeota archaeon]|nr:phosphatase PAP2 family protein [Candidatus Woesearchaeota archaeon]
MRKKIIIGLVLILASFLLNDRAKSLASTIRSPFLDTTAEIVSSLMIIAVFLIPSIHLFSRNRKLMPALYISLAVSIIASYSLKLLLRIERPFEQKTIPFTNLDDYSFPSTHSTLAFAPLSFLKGTANTAWMIFGFVVIASRIYLGLHRMSDTVAGAVLGYIIGSFFLDNSRFDLKKDMLEVKRQTFHLIAGLSIVFLIYKGYLNQPIMIMVLLAAIIISRASIRTDIPIICWFLDNFERKEERKIFPGKGAILMILGAFIALVFFPLKIALASIAILALSDSFSHIVGRFFGRTRQPFSTKLIEGTIAGISAGFLGAVFFVGANQALIGSTLAMAAETIGMRINGIEIDDNIMIPIIAGLSMWLLTIF